MILEHFRTARESLRRTRTRTLLTISGVAIGIMSITTILALGSGITSMTNRQVSDLGETKLVVRPLSQSSNLIDFANPTPQTSYTTSPFTDRDLTDISKVPDVKAIAPLMTISGNVRSKDQDPKVSTVLATTPSFAKTTNFELKEGQFIDETTLEDTATIGQQLAIDLFGTDDATGRYFTIKGQRFTVIGVIKRQNNPINFNNVNLDHSAIISLDSGKLFNGGVAQIQQINVITDKAGDTPVIKNQISSLLTRNHDNEKDTSVLSGTEISDPTNRFFILIKIVMSLIAGISLLVGGIGIMNIMLVGVAERTREIGLRKAVGASNQSIVAQFMVESLILSFIGGLLGYIGGYTIAFLVSLMLPYDPVLTWEIAAIAFGLAIGVGTLFGVYPAIKAARKNPIESLRRMH